MMREMEMERGPVEQPAAIGVDQAPESRPGVPMEAEPPQPDPGAHWTQPEQQWVRRKHFHRKGLDRLTPVFGNAVPPRGASGVLRRIAYWIPEHKARHWMLLLAADRVDVVEGRIGRGLARPLRRTPLARYSDTVEQNPLRAIAVASVALLGASLLLRGARD